MLGCGRGVDGCSAERLRGSGLDLTWSRLKLLVEPSSGRRLDGIEGLRGLAAFSIVVVHTWGLAPGGPPGLRGFGAYLNDLSYGVTLFFTLSGFLLYRPFADALVRGSDRPSFSRYLRNRALRIAPAYLVILLLSALVLGSVFVRGPNGELDHGRLADPGLLLRAALLVQDYQPSTLLTGIGPAWSLAVEVVFYLSLPLLVLIAWRLGARSRAVSRRIAAGLAPAAVLLIIGLAGKAAAMWAVQPASAYAGYRTDWHSVLERSFVCQADLFAFGMALAVFHSAWKAGKVRLPSRWRLIAIGTGLGAYAVSVRVSTTEHQLSYSYYNTLIALACSMVAALVVLEARPKTSRLVRLLDSKPFVAAGLISYSVFLWHGQLIFNLRDSGLLFGGGTGLLLNVAIVVAVTVALSVLTYTFVEAPALRLKVSMLGQRTPESLTAAQTAP
jgi:peptidoglycan/LPS O-acetylase OafA/YrhL